MRHGYTYSSLDKMQLYTAGEQTFMLALGQIWYALSGFDQNLYLQLN